jgi:hypothetical protein
MTAGRREALREGVKLWRAALGAFVAALVALDLLRFLDATPALVLAAAAGPALLWTLLVALPALRRGLRAGLLALAVVAGAVVAVSLAARLNAQLALDPVAQAPLVEEAVKAVPLVLLLLLRPAAFAAVRDGATYGALVGIGFALAENAQYLTLAGVAGGGFGLLRTLYLRGGLEGLNHAVFTATVGAGLAWSRSTRARWLAAPLALGVATAEHALWNGFASRALTDALCNAPAPGGPCGDPDVVDLFVTAPLITAATIGPPLALLALGLRARRFVK